MGVRLLSENFSTGYTVLQNLNIYEYIFTHSFNQQILNTFSVLGNENIVNAVVVSVGPNPHRMFLIKPHLSYFQFPYHKQWVLRFQFSYYWSSATYPKFSLEFSRKKNDQLGNHLGWESHLTLTTALVRGWRKEGRQTLALGSCC